MKTAKSFAWALVLTIPSLLVACSPKANEAKTADQAEEDFIASVRGNAPEQQAPAPAPQPAAAQPPAETKQTGTPKIELETANYDMGTVASNQIAVQRMKVFNRGTAPLKIAQVKTSCGCTTGEMEQNLIAAGGEGTLIIRVDPKKVHGFYAKKVLTLYSNDPLTPHAAVNVETRVQPEVQLDPEVLDVGRIELGTPKTTKVRVRQLQDTPLEISGVVFQRDPPFFKVSSVMVPEAEWKTPGKREYELTVDVLAEAPPDSYDEWIILSTNIERTPQLPYKFLGTIVGPFEFLPKTVALRGVAPGQVQANVLTLTGKKDVKIIEVTNTNQSIQVSYHPMDRPAVVAFDAVVPQRTATPSLRDTWKIAFEMDGKRFEESVPVIVILTRENPPAN